MIRYPRQPENNIKYRVRADHPRSASFSEAEVTSVGNVGNLREEVTSFSAYTRVWTVRNLVLLAVQYNTHRSEGYWKNTKKTSVCTSERKS